MALFKYWFKWLAGLSDLSLPDPQGLLNEVVKLVHTFNYVVLCTVHIPLAVLCNFSMRNLFQELDTQDYWYICMHLLNCSWFGCRLKANKLLLSMQHKCFQLPIIFRCQPRIVSRFFIAFLANHVRISYVAM